MSKKFKVEIAPVNLDEDNTNEATIIESIQMWLLNHDHGTNTGKFAYDFKTGILTVPDDVGQALEEQKADPYDIVNQYLIEGNIAVDRPC